MSIEVNPNLLVFNVKQSDKAWRQIMQGNRFLIRDKLIFPTIDNKWIMFLLIVCLFVSHFNI